MLFPEEDEVHLKRWIVKRLENTSVALAPPSFTHLDVVPHGLLLDHS